MSAEQPPTRQSFLEAPLAEIKKISPMAVAYAQGGTRRSAVFAGVSPESDDYPRWSRKRVVECAQVIFSHGADHLFMVALTPKNFTEVGEYRDKLLTAATWTIASEEAIADYNRLGWRARIVGSPVPELATIGQKLVNDTPAEAEKTLWYLIQSDFDDPWQQILDAAHNSKAGNRREAVQALYGENLPLVTLFLASGKPMVAPSLLPPLLYDRLQCYWLQRPGFHLSEKDWRTILYDYTYVRPTWRQDKKGRAETAFQHKGVWESAPIFGLGQPLGDFWYPEAIPPVT